MKRRVLGFLLVVLAIAGTWGQSHTVTLEAYTLSGEGVYDISKVFHYERPSDSDKVATVRALVEVLGLSSAAQKTLTTEALNQDFLKEPRVRRILKNYQLSSLRASEVQFICTVDDYGLPGGPAEFILLALDSEGNVFGTSGTFTGSFNPKKKAGLLNKLWDKAGDVLEDL